MKLAVYKMRALCFLTTVLIESNFGNALLYSKFCKYYCSQEAFLCADDCMEINGGGGYMEDTGIPHLVKDARSYSFLMDNDPDIIRKLWNTIRIGKRLSVISKNRGNEQFIGYQNGGFSDHC
ncbi:MAG: hypothetical protein IPL53_21390 [Ignavibacteria bacterium]|nr:hypothetical protein [Ignavibacteria bacterium]